MGKVYQAGKRFVEKLRLHLNGLVDHVLGALVEDDDILLVEVGYEELGLVDHAVEGVSQSVLVRVVKSVAGAAAQGGVVDLDVLLQGGDNNEEGEGHASALTLGQQKTVGVPAGAVSLFKVILALALQSVVDSLVHITDSGGVFNGREDIAGVAGDDVLTGSHCK